MVTNLKQLEHDREKSSEQLRLINFDLAKEVAFKDARARLGELIQEMDELAVFSDAVTSFFADFANSQVGQCTCAPRHHRQANPKKKVNFI